MSAELDYYEQQDPREAYLAEYEREELAELRSEFTDEEGLGFFD